jgi:hypothetical protein
VTGLPRRHRDGHFTVAPRHQLLLRAALGDDERSLAAYRTWSDGIDVRRIDLASQRFLPRLLSNLLRLGAATDDPLLEQFRKVTRFTWLKTQFLIAQSEPLVAALGQAGIPAMVLKGAAVVHHTGGDVALRPMDDIDLAVPFGSLHAALGVAADVGFPPDGPALSHRELSAMAEGFHALGTRNGAGALVDLHWHVLPGSLHPDADVEFWQAAEPAHLGQVLCCASSREDTIVHAVAHAARPEADPTLRWAADVAALVRSAPTAGIDWDRVVRQARRHRIALQTAQALDVVRRLADLPVPAPVTDALGRSRVPLAERIEAHPRRRSDGRPRLPHQGEQLADAYQGYVRRKVPPGRRPAPLEPVRFLGEWWDLPSARQVPAHAGFVALGRPWHRSPHLSAHLDGASPAPAPPVRLGQTTTFTIGGDGGPYLGAGWSFPEEHGTWTRSREAAVRMALSEPFPTQLALEFVLVPFLAPGRRRLTVDVVVQRHLVARWSFIGASWQPEERRVEVPAPVLSGADHLDLRLVIHRPATPESLGVDTGNRPLGLSLHSLRLSGVEPC